MKFKLICHKCGAVNELDQMELSDFNAEIMKNRVPPSGSVDLTVKEFHWVLPAGVITSCSGKTTYVSGNGEHLSREEYLRRYNLDPKISLEMMRNTLRFGMVKTTETNTEDK